MIETSINLDERIPVFLTKEEAALFVLFQQNYDSIAFLISQNVFDIRNGNAILSFTQDGQLKSIKKELFCYR